jgi:hypothetical protein
MTARQRSKREAVKNGVRIDVKSSLRRSQTVISVKLHASLPKVFPFLLAHHFPSWFWRVKLTVGGIEIDTPSVILLINEVCQPATKA